MKVRKVTEGYTDVRVGLLAIPVVEGSPYGAAFHAVDEALDGALTRVVREERFSRRDGSALLVHTHGRIGPRRILLVGLSKASHWPEAPARLFAHVAIANARRRRAKRVAVAWPFAGGRKALAQAAEELVLGAALATYRFDRYRTNGNGDGERAEVAELVIAAPKDVARRLTRPVAEEAAARAFARANGVRLARDLVNTPPNDLQPRHLVEHARAIAAESSAISVEVLDRAALEAGGYGLLAAVAQGATSEPALIHMTYEPEGGAADGTPSVALLGKGITFDAGGLDIKTRGNMQDMKCDMGGAAAVLGAMAALAALKPRVRVHGIVPAAENLINGQAYRPGDVLRSLSGKTVEVMNTDAEGRLALADAITHAIRAGVDEVIDLATLTGACAVALGELNAGLFSNRRALADRLLKAARDAGESLWELPVDRRLKRELKSPVADLKNIGGRYGGAIHGALFLEAFVEKRPWAHLDIAGPAFTSRSEMAVPKGGTGYGVLTLLAYLEGLA